MASQSAAPPSPFGAGLGAFALAVGRQRWTICFILFLAATINYVDRQVIAVLKPDLARDQRWTELDYSHIVLSFQVAYAIGMVSMGWLLDKVGTKAGLAIAATIWGIAATGHWLAGSVLGFAIARFALGIGEAGMFPAGVKVIAQWFPKRERAFALGLFNAGVNVGAIATPLAVPWIVEKYGLRAAFIATGGLALLWVFLWLAKYQVPDQHPKLSAREKEWIRSDPVTTYPKIPWVRLLPWKQTWAFAIAKFLTDPIWWFYLFWVPPFLNRTHGITLTKMGPPLVTIYVMADIGSVLGGWLSSTFLRSGWSVNRARKFSMILCASFVAPIVFAASAHSTGVAVVLIGLAAAGHQGFAANLFTLTSDLFPEKAVASVCGFGGMFGAIGGILIALVVGLVLQATGSYYTLFIAAPTAYVLAIGVVHILSPQLEPAMSRV
jgi:ACS family hexuronate transporter-like MFS transporter